jgi:transketolase
MTMDDLMSLRAIDSPIDGHPNPVLGFPFFDAATGSLGQGLSVSGGLAGAARIDRIDKTIYCIMGDGESREGQIWEAMDFIADHALTNVVAIFNCNTLGQSDFVSAAEDWQQLKLKAEAFRWTAVAIDGHDPDAIEDTLRRRKELGAGKPLCVVARTVKGWGEPNLSGMGHHGQPVPKGGLEAVLAQLDQRAEELGVAHLDPAAMKDALQIAPPLPAPETSRAREPIGFAEAVGNEPKVAEALAKKKVLSPRRAYGLALKALGAANPAVVALDADVKNSTFTEEFMTTAPQRFFEGYIAEQNMVGMSMGLAARGKIPFCSTFACFFTRAFDFIRMAAISQLNVKFAGTHVGVSIGEDGPSQMGLEDIAMFAAEPNFTVLYPSDATSAWAATMLAAELVGPTYIRLGRPNNPIVYSPDEKFEIGKSKVLRQGNNDRILVVAAGITLFETLKAYDELKKSGIDVRVVDLFSVQPIDRATLLASARAAGNQVITVEDHYSHGGLGDAVQSALSSERIPVYKIAVTEIPHSGKPQELVEKFGISSKSIIAKVRELVK